jgi:peptidoglycan hydrolase CwlO-like protein
MNRIVLLSVLASVAVVALAATLAGGAYAYHHQVSHVSKLKSERAALTAQLSGTQAKLLTTRGKLVRTQLKLGKRVRSLNTAKNNLTKMSKDLAAAEQRADQNYSAGYSSGNASGYSSGYDAGNSSGYDSGLSAGSDSLTCSDDADVYWLPACNY